MAYEIKDKLFLDIQFDGASIKLDSLNAVDFLHMSCSTRIAIPMLHMRLRDTAQTLLNKKSLHSGSPITILLRSGKESNPIKKYEFVLNSWGEKRSNGAMVYELDAYFNVPLYWNASSFKNFKGTSTNTIAEIAKACQIKNFVGDSCTDDQMWSFDNVPWHEAARRISERGFISETSCMQLGLDLDGSLFYKDVSKMGNVAQMFVYPGGSGSGYPVVSYKPKSFPGSSNQQSGYQKSRIEQDLFSESLFKQHQKVAVTKNESGSMQVDNTIKNKVTQSRVEFCPIDVGNVSETYERALYQNRRVAALFNTGLDILVPASCGVKIFDTVSIVFNVNKEVAANVKQYEKEYLVSSRAICVLGSEVVEKLELTRRTLNTDNKDAASGDTSGELLSKERPPTIAPNEAGATTPAGPPPPPPIPDPPMSLQDMFNQRDALTASLTSLASAKDSLQSQVASSLGTLTGTSIPGTLDKLASQAQMDMQYNQILENAVQQKQAKKQLSDMLMNIAKLR